MKANLKPLLHSYHFKEVKLMAEDKESSAVHWADKVLIRGMDIDVAEAERVRRRSLGPLPDCFQVFGHELRKTAFETQTIALISKLMDLMAKSFDIDPRGILPSRVHILSSENYRLFLGGDDETRTVLGHTYIVRPKNRVVEMFLLTHELVHLSSYLCLTITVDSRASTVSWKKSGYEQRGRNGRQFSGLNKAVAEIIAQLLRELVIRRSGLLKGDQKNILTDKCLYSPQVQVVRALIDRIAQHENCDKTDLIFDIISGFLAGRTSFIRRANRAVPGAAAILRSMSPQLESAVVAAYALGLHDVYAELRESENQALTLDLS
jgi:hypothetical protein